MTDPALVAAIARLEAGQREVLAELRRRRAPAKTAKAVTPKKRQHLAPARPPQDELAKAIARRELRRLGV